MNDLERPIGTYLYGRRIYEVMAFWERLPAEGDGWVNWSGLATIAHEVVPAIAVSLDRLLRTNRLQNRSGLVD